MAMRQQDIMADLAYARAEAIKESRRAIMQRAAGATNTWKDGWQICVDLDGDNDCAAAEVRKTTSPIGGRTRVCTTDAALANTIVFRPDGRMNAPTNNVGILISDDRDDADASNNRARLVLLGLSGRASVQIQDGGATCP